MAEDSRPEPMAGENRMSRKPFRHFWLGRWNVGFKLGRFRTGWHRRGWHAGSIGLPFAVVTYYRITKAHANSRRRNPG